MSAYYKFNIARQSGTTFAKKPRYVHYCAIKFEESNINLEGSNIRHEMHLKAFTDDLRKRFPMPEFKIDVTLWQSRSYSEAEF